MFSRARYDEVRREIEAILDDITLPRHLQVSRIIDLFDPPGSADIVDWLPDETTPSSQRQRVDVANDAPPPKRAARKKRANTTKRRT